MKCNYIDCGEEAVNYVENARGHNEWFCEPHLEAARQSAVDRKELTNSKFRDRNRGKRAQTALWDNTNAATQGDSTTIWKDKLDT